MDSQVNIVIAGSVVRALRDSEKGKHGQPSQHCDCRKCNETPEELQRFHMNTLFVHWSVC